MRITKFLRFRGDDSDLSTLQYLDSPLEDVAAVGSLEYNAVVASEVIEHSADPNQFVHLCASVLKVRSAFMAIKIAKFRLVGLVGKGFATEAVKPNWILNRIKVIGKTYISTLIALRSTVEIRNVELQPYG